MRDFTPRGNVHLTHAVIYDSAFKHKWWHRLVPRRWRPTSFIAFIDLSKEDV